MTLMDFSDSQYARLIIALIGGITLFALVYRVPEKTTLSILILLVPFQVFDSKYGSLNTILVYLISFAYLLQGRLSKLPFLRPIFVVLFAYLLAFSQSHPAARIQHISYLVGFFSNVLLFYLVYNFVLRTKDWKYILRLLIALNIVVVIYCGIQFFFGREQFMLFGIEELAMNTIRDDGRLVGPFQATAATAEYLSLQCMFLAYILIHNPRRSLRRLMIGLLTLNCVFLISTGNRGGFVTLVLGGLLFLFVFRRELGLARTAKMLVVGTTMFVAVALVVVNFTEYGMLFERLEDTRIEGGVPDTRANAWPRTWVRIQEKPILGHGPKLYISSNTTPVADIPVMLFAHNLPLHILYTTGIVGLVAWMIFFWALTARLLAVRKATCEDRELAGYPRLGLLIIFVFLVSQLRIEFLRDALVDYQNYLFIVFAFLLSTRDLIVIEARNDTRQRGFGRNFVNESDRIAESFSGAAKVSVTRS